mgnify:CR=1 FL=1
MFRKRGEWLAADRAELLETLAQLLLDARAVPAVARHLRALLPDLVSRVLASAEGAAFDLCRHERVGAMFAALLPTAPHLRALAVQYYRTPPCAPPFERVVRGGAAAADVAAVKAAVETTFWLATSFPHDFVGLWAWPVFYDLLALGDSDAEREIKWFAVRTLAVVHDMGDAQTRSALAK